MTNPVQPRPLSVGGGLVKSAALLAAILSASVAVALPQAAPNGLGQPAPISADVQNARDAFLAANPGATFFMKDLGVGRVYGSAFSSGATPVDSADAFVNAHAGVFGVNAADLLPVGPFPSRERLVPLMYDATTGSSKFTLVTYSQSLNGIPVFRSDLRVVVRNEATFPAVLASSTLRDLGEFAATFNQAAPDLASIDTKKLLRVVGNQFRQRPTISDLEVVIFAGAGDAIETPRLAYKFIAEGGLTFQPENYKKFLYVVDAETSKILYQEDQVCFIDASGNAGGMATPGTGADICAFEEVAGLPYAKVTINGQTYYADVDGNFFVTGVASGAQVTSTIGGLYFTVADQAGPISSISQTAGSAMAFVHNEPNLDPLVRAQINAYIHANIIRDLVLEQNPSYPTIAGQVGASAMTINVNLANTCNAFYNGSINFYQAGGGCANTAFATVVHHEYGHHVVASGGSGQGAYGEGMSDCMGILVTDESITGFGFSSNCASGIRDANNSCQYSATSCSDCGSEVHACGKLISGCVWDLRENWAQLYPNDYLERLKTIVVNSVPLHGNTSSIGADIVIDFLVLDDDNSDINDGTPNYASIADAFGQHGLPAPAIQPIKFTYPNGIPSTVAPTGSTILSVKVEAVASQPQPGTGLFFWRNGTSGSFTSVPMTQVSANNYEVAVPATVCLSTVQWYVSASTTSNVAVTNPLGAPSTVYSSISAAGSTEIFNNTLEGSIAGWQLGVAGDTASVGQWVHVDPNPTSAQPGDDHTPNGVLCFVTGQGTPGGSLGEADIDGGTTTLVSPTFDATGYDEAFISYWRWYSNDQGASPNADSMPVQISNNNGGTWVTLETVATNANAWVFKSFRIADFVTPTAQMKLRFQASDLGSGSLVEAGVDDLVLTGISCTPENVADLNGDGIVSADDLAILLGAWGNTSPGDLNGDGIVGADDLALLLGAWG